MLIYWHILQVDVPVNSQKNKVTAQPSLTFHTSITKITNGASPRMETFGCSFFVHSGWATGSNSDAVGVAVTAESCVKRRRSRGRRKRPARGDERAESCEDGVMVATSPLTAKVGLWDAAGEKTKL